MIRHGCVWIVLGLLAAPLGAYRLPIKFYRNADGLPQQQVKAVVQDAQGNIFAATQGGVGIYDGQAFVHLSVRQGLPSADVNALAVDGRGRVWIGTALGLARYEKGEVRTLSLPAGMDACILGLRVRGDLIYASNRRGLYVYDGSRFTRVFSGSPLAFDVEAGGRINILTDKELFIMDELASDEVHPLPSPASPAVVLRTRDGAVLAGTSHGLSRWKDGKWTTVLSGLAVADCLEDRLGQLWVATQDAGIRHFSAGRWETFAKFGGIDITRIYSIYEDREGNLWFGTIAGLGEAANLKMTIYGTEDGLPPVMSSCFVEDGSGTLRVGYLGGVARFEREGRRFIAEPWPGLSGVVVRALGYDGAGRLWLGTEDNGLFVREHGEVRHVADAAGRPVDRVYHIVPDGAGGLWICTRSGILRTDGTHFLRYDEGDGLPSAAVYGGALSPQGIFYAATQKGVVSFDGRRFAVPPALKTLTTEVNCLFFDASGKLWIGTHGLGLLALAGDAIETFAGPLSLPDDFVWEIQQDRQGQIWAAGNNGIHMRRETFWLTKNSHSGLPGDEIFIHSAFRDSLGDLWFGLPSGTLCVHTDGDVYNTVEPGLHLIRMKTPLREYSGFSLPKTLSPEERTLEFDFAGLSFQDENQVLFQSYLEPLEKLWTPPTPRASTRYTFVLRACNNSLVWNSQPLRYSFEIRPQPTETWWFKIGIILMVLLGVAAAFHFRMRNLVRARNSLERVVREKTEDLHKEMEVIESLSQTDGLTALCNRRHFIQRFEEAVEFSRRYKDPFCIVLIDIDNFKEVNDTFGHLVGDRVLERFARHLEAGFRSTDILARYGGDEFVILMHQAGPEEARDRVTHILGEVRQRTFLDRETAISLTFSAGIAYVRPEAVADITFDTVVGAADRCMYQAKKAGKNRILFREIGRPESEDSEG